MKYIKPFALLVFAALMTGCIKEDLSSCKVDFRLLFSYKGDGEEEIFHDKITKVNLYVFDCDDKFVMSQTLDKEILNVSPSAELSLPAGEYRFVGVGNCFENTATVGLKENEPADMTQCLVGHPCAFTEGVMTCNDSLYMTSGAIRVVQGEAGEDTAAFEASHIDMYVEVRGVDAPNTSVVLRHPYKYTNFENDPCGDPCAFYPECAVDDESGKTTVVARFNVPRFASEDDVTLDVVGKEGEKIHTVDIGQFVKDQKIDLAKNEVLVPVLVEFQSVGVTVTVPEWAGDEIEPEF